MSSVGCSYSCDFFAFSIIKRLEEYDEFFPAFQSLVSQLYDLLGKYVVQLKGLVCLQSTTSPCYPFHDDGAVSQTLRSNVD
jgi:hypothetical protein